MRREGTIYQRVNISGPSDTWDIHKHSRKCGCANNALAQRTLTAAGANFECYGRQLQVGSGKAQRLRDLLLRARLDPNYS
jgi:hypothetical protein